MSVEIAVFMYKFLRIIVESLFSSYFIKCSATSDFVYFDRSDFQGTNLQH